VLILPPGHGQVVQARPKLARRERRLAAVVGAVLAGLIVAVLVAASIGSAPRSGRGCVNATVPGFIGATDFHDCGAAARRLCSTLGPGAGLGTYGLRVLASACRRAGDAVPHGL
jgi:hypothetical protein